MFATIKTNGATDIAIYIPHDGADKSLPMLARMLEENAVFLCSGYQELKVVTPTLGISLGNEFRIENYGQEALVSAVSPSPSVISDGFVPMTPLIFASNKKGLDAKDAEIKRLRTEVDYVKSQLAAALNELAAAREVAA